MAFFGNLLDSSGLLNSGRPFVKVELNYIVHLLCLRCFRLDVDAQIYQSIRNARCHSKKSIEANR